MTARTYTYAVPARQAREPKRPAPASAGRAAQRRRTRAAIVAATRELIAGGKTPSIDEIAAAADVSRRTIYMYFPTVDQLVLDATAGLLSEATIDEALDADRDGDDVFARTDALVRAFVALAPETLPLGRKIIKLTVDAPPPEDGNRRGHRRVQWIERAVEPIRAELGAEQYEQLVSALSVVLGWEAMVVLRDVRALDAIDEEATLRWMTRALVESALRKADISA
jgi:AcrR family transcriptional regulator